MLEILSKYVRYSGVWINLALNPFHWQIRFETVQPDDLNPNARGFFLVIGPLSVRLVLDDGSW